MSTGFTQLNHGWNAEPNAPSPRIEVMAPALRLSFTVNPWAFGFEERARATLVFTGCWRYRLGPPNDEGWYSGECRFARLAPRWGEFYEVDRDVLASHVLDWKLLTQRKAKDSRHFLFYLRDETFECDAEEWFIELPPRRTDGLESKT